MGLSGRKVKQRIPNDPRNLSWADNATKFGQTYLSKLGWDPSKGLGVDGAGRTSHIKVSQKLDMLGIGAARAGDPDGIAWKQNKEFEAVLRRLNEEAERVKEEEGGDAGKGKKRRRGEEDGKEKKKKRKKDSEPVIEAPAPRYKAHRARAVASKHLASKSAAAISEILGIAPSAARVVAQVEEEVVHEGLTTSTKSVAEYFKERLAGTVSARDADGEAPRMGLGFASLTSGALLAAADGRDEDVAEGKAEKSPLDVRDKRRRDKKAKKEKRRR